MVQKKFPSLFSQPHVGVWLSIQENLGLADATVEAYARALLDYTNFCSLSAIDISSAGGGLIQGEYRLRQHDSNDPLLRQMWQ